MRIGSQLHLVVIIGLFMLFGCSGADLLNATIPSTGYSVIKDIPYEEGDRHTLDVYVPENLAPGHPVVVFYYGGSWQMGNKNDYLFAGQAFASKGYITVIADYRLYPDVYYPTFMEDVAASFVWTQNHIAEYGGNTKNIFVAGHSAGAYNAIMLTLNRSFLKEEGGKNKWIKGAIGISGPYDFLPLTDPKIIDIFSKEKQSDGQPITYARAGLPPILLLTGDQDTDVSPLNSLNLAARLRELNDPVIQITYRGITHIGIALALADGFRDDAPVLEDIAKFINSHTNVE